MSGSSVLSSVLRRDRWIVTGGLAVAVGLSWLYLLRQPSMDMHTMGDMVMPMEPAPWTPASFALVLAMWVVMMAAMMLPSAAPLILLYGRAARQREARGTAAPGAGLLALGYLLVWSAFSLLATLLQWGLDRAALLSPQMATTSVAAAGVVLVAAGLYQWTPLKQACLRRCRSPLDFLLHHWREGRRGAVAMGAHHGVLCLGCCWMLMLLLFVGGVMNLLWVAGIALYVLIEKVAPQGRAISRAMGAVLILWGASVLTGAFGIA